MTLHGFQNSKLLWLVAIILALHANACESNDNHDDENSAPGPSEQRANPESESQPEAVTHGSDNQLASVTPLRVPSNFHRSATESFEGPIVVDASSVEPYRYTTLYHEQDADPLGDGDTSTGICVANSGTLKWFNLEGDRRAMRSNPEAIWIYLPIASERPRAATLEANGQTIPIEPPVPGQWVPTRFSPPLRTSRVELELTGSNVCITEVRWSKADDPWLAVAGPWARASHCGHPAHHPSTIRDTDWVQYACMSQAEAGATWSSCLPRDAYSPSAGRGCPGAERCCPGGR